MERRNATIFIYDEIGQSGISAKAFIENLNNMKEQAVDIKINSPGGNVFEGLAIYNAIKDYGGKTIAYVDGLAGGIASIIAFAASEVWMKNDALLMICGPSISVVESGDMAKIQIEMINKITDSFAEIYVKAFKKSNEEIRKMMANGTWMTAQEALVLGIIAGTYN
jgi:ATP-dependent protease ClpP protease subunit